MIFKAHNRFLISVSLIVIIAAFAFTITQGAGNDRYLMASANDCVEMSGGVRPDTSAGVLAARKGCYGPAYNAEPITLLMFGIGLTGFAYAARRHFDRLN